MTVWTVPATVERVIDGDTIVATLDLGWGLYKTDHVRLANINASELSTPEGKDARAFLADMLPVHSGVTVVSHKLDKYGRCLATVTHEEININDLMVTTGHAVPYMVAT